ncbi:hypothetical protein M3Y98_00831300 [Aphelenchoides besseyi]|nr:hypothetical protein M3Y98_00831300 [Aphelenchoides besseyi]KAI6195425.1 hypothetical protein M3Y96_01229900 [Aphelenchoides besseyi]
MGFRGNNSIRGRGNWNSPNRGGGGGFRRGAGDRGRGGQRRSFGSNDRNSSRGSFQGNQRGNFRGHRGTPRGGFNKFGGNRTSSEGSSSGFFKQTNRKRTFKDDDEDEKVSPVQRKKQFNGPSGDSTPKHKFVQKQPVSSESEESSDEPQVKSVAKKSSGGQPPKVKSTQQTAKGKSNAIDMSSDNGMESDYGSTEFEDSDFEDSEFDDSEEDTSPIKTPQTKLASSTPKPNKKTIESDDSKSDQSTEQIDLSALVDGSAKEKKKPNGVTAKSTEKVKSLKQLEESSSGDESDDEFSAPNTKSTPKSILKTPGAQGTIKKNVKMDADKSPVQSKTPVTPHPVAKGPKQTPKSLQSLQNFEDSTDSEINSDDLDSGDFEDVVIEDDLEEDELEEDELEEEESFGGEESKALKELRRIKAVLTTDRAKVGSNTEPLIQKTFPAVLTACDELDKRLRRVESLLKKNGLQ